jgi:hypothetical protein
MFSANFNNSWVNHPSTFQEILLWFLGIAGGTAILWARNKIFDSRCPKCKKFFSGQISGGKILNEIKFVKTVKYKTGKLDKAGHPIWAAENKFHIRTHYRIYFSCGYCGDIGDWYKNMCTERIP